MFSKLEERDTGIDFVNDNYETERSNILTYEYFYNGGGVTLGDINNDGLIDIYFSSNLFSNKLYLNQGNFRFKDITENSHTACDVGWKTGVVMVDINADGFLDIYVCRSASPDPERRRNILLINNGDNTFTDKAQEYNLDDSSYSTQAAFFDFDHDGDLDVILLNHSLLAISNSFDINLRNTNVRFSHVGNKFLKNQNGKFIDVSDSIGVYGSASNYGLGISLSDVNNDGWIDMYTGCDYTGRDKLLLNQQGQFFADATDSLSHISKFTMGTDIADFNGDGLMDIYTLDMLPEDNYRQKQLMGSDRYESFSAMVRNGLHRQYMRNMLHINNGNGTFSEIGQLAGISNTDWSWAALFADFDNDGNQDLFVSNGFKRDLTDNDFAKFKAQEETLLAQKMGKKKSILEVIGKFSENKLPNYVFRGNGDLTFTKKTDEWGLGEPTLTNGAAYGDLDNDGDLDLVMNNVNDLAGIYKNNASSLVEHHYLKVQLHGIGRNTSALGARVTVFLKGKKLTREMLPVRGFQSSVDPVLHFGIGALDKVDSVRIQWPAGGEEMLRGVAVDQKIVIKENHNHPVKNREDSTHQYFDKEAGGIDFNHLENNYTDFRVQSLLPRLYSTMGPPMAGGDVNSDGLTDLYLGGAKGQSGQLFLQDGDGNFKRSPQTEFSNGVQSEDVAAVFFDMDDDGDQDLYIVTGGYEFEANDPLLADRLYENDGKGKFKERKLTAFFSSGSCVKPCDIDNDGDTDLFIGGRIVPSRYPEKPESAVLLNDGTGNFTIDEKQTDEIRRAGMVTDAIWVDLNKDKYQDLIVVGEWMPIRVFINEKGLLAEKSSEYIKEKSEGCWNCILVEDFDKDGDSDFIIGNHGLNNQMKVTAQTPATLVYSDFDGNGSVDPVMSYYIQGKSYPYPTRDELAEQLPFIKKRFTDYKSYSGAMLEDILTPDEIKGSTKLSAYQLQTCFLRNDPDGLKLIPLPQQIQFSPVFAMQSMDVNHDGNPDLITAGNLTGTRSRTGALTGNNGFILTGDGRGNFAFVHPILTGLQLKGDVRYLLVDKTKLIAAINNSAVHVYKLK